MEISFKCPTCGSVTIDVKGGYCNQSIICPKCLRNGINSIMLEETGNTHQNMGGGFFTRAKPKNNV